MIRIVKEKSAISADARGREQKEAALRPKEKAWTGKRLQPDLNLTKEII